MVIQKEINQIKDKYNSFKTEAETYLRLIDEKENKIKDHEKQYDNMIKARWVITEVGKNTQEKLKEYIESMVTTALQAVFEKDYEFKINFNIKRNKPEAELKIKFNGIELDPKDEVGGGIVDVASFALRIVLWSLQKPKTSNILFLDEPFKFLHGNLDQACKMIKKISENLNLQLIIVTQFEEFFDIADKIFECKLNKEGITEVKDLL